MTNPYIRACWSCGGSGRTRTGPDYTFAPCPQCSGHGRIKITYGQDADGGLTQVVEPQPDAPLDSAVAIPHSIRQFRKARGYRAED